MCNGCNYFSCKKSVYQCNDMHLDLMNLIMSNFITYVLIKLVESAFCNVSISSRRTMHHLHDCQAEEFLYHPQADPPPTQQQRPSLIRIHILRQLFLEEKTNTKCHWLTPWVTLREHHSQQTWSCGHGLSLMIPLRQVMPRSTESLQSDICWQRVVLTTARGIMSWRDALQCLMVWLRVKWAL